MTRRASEWVRKRLSEAKVDKHSNKDRFAQEHDHWTPSQLQEVCEVGFDAGSSDGPDEQPTRRLAGHMGGRRPDESERRKDDKEQEPKQKCGEGRNARANRSRGAVAIEDGNESHDRYQERYSKELHDGRGLPSLRSKNKSRCNHLRDVVNGPAQQDPRYARRGVKRTQNQWIKHHGNGREQCHANHSQKGKSFVLLCRRERRRHSQRRRCPTDADRAARHQSLHMTLASRTPNTIVATTEPAIPMAVPHPRLATCSTVMRAPKRATPQRRPVRANTETPAITRSVAERKLHAQPMSSAYRSCGPPWCSATKVEASAISAQTRKPGHRLVSRVAAEPRARRLFEEWVEGDIDTQHRFFA